MYQLTGFKEEAMALTPDSFRRSPRMLATLMMASAVLSLFIIAYLI